MANKNLMHVQVYRSPAEDSEDRNREGIYCEFGIPYKDRATVLNILDYIHENCDRSLTYYKSCRIGKCTGCLVHVDGSDVLACTTLAEDGMRIGPARRGKVIRDLIIKFPS